MTEFKIYCFEYVIVNERETFERVEPKLKLKCSYFLDFLKLNCSYPVLNNWTYLRMYSLKLESHSLIKLFLVLTNDFSLGLFWAYSVFLAKCER